MPVTLHITNDRLFFSALVTYGGMFSKLTGKAVNGQSSSGQRKGWRGLSQRKDNPANFKSRIIKLGRNVGLDEGGVEVVDGGGTSGDELPQSQFVNNAVKSSKYTVWTFLPK